MHCPEIRANFKWASGTLPRLHLLPRSVVFANRLLPTDMSVAKNLHISKIHHRQYKFDVNTWINRV